MLDSKALFYLCYFGYENTVIDSQVVVPVSQLYAQGIRPVLIFYESLAKFFLSSKFKNEKIQSLKNKNIHFHFMPRVPRNFMYLNSLSLFFVMAGQLLSGRPVVVHARGIQGAHCALYLKKLFSKLRIICDVRGIESEEYELNIVSVKKRSLRFYESWWKRQLEKIQAYSIKNADVNIFVSKACRDYFRCEKSEFIPCATDTDVYRNALTDRMKNRAQFSWSNRLVVVYSGGKQVWQNLKSLPIIFKLIQKISPQSFFLGLSPDWAELTALFQSQEIDPASYKMLAVSNQEIPNYLASADVGLLLREKNIVNALSCPTKFAEYLAAGLFIFTTRAVKDIESIVEKEGVGIFVDEALSAKGNHETLLSALIKINNTEERIMRSHQLASEAYDWKNYVPVLKKWYLQLLS